jgi:hypothetical protein
MRLYCLKFLLLYKKRPIEKSNFENKSLPFNKIKNKILNFIDNSLKKIYTNL